MKAPICSKCRKTIKRTVGFLLQGDVAYYLNSERCGYMVPTGDVYEGIWKFRKSHLIGIYCRYCRTMFPESMWKEIKNYLKESHLLKKLTGH